MIMLTSPITRKVVSLSCATMASMRRNPAGFRKGMIPSITSTRARAMVSSPHISGIGSVNDGAFFHRPRGARKFYLLLRYLPPGRLKYLKKSESGCSNSILLPLLKLFW